MKKLGEYSILREDNSSVIKKTVEIKADSQRTCTIKSGEGAVGKEDRVFQIKQMTYLCRS